MKKETPDLKDIKKENQHLKELLAIALEAFHKLSGFGSPIAKAAFERINYGIDEDRQ